ncbi:MAG: rhomboid family intramembrane serine protease [Pseudomonadota bacterium]
MLGLIYLSLAGVVWRREWALDLYRGPEISMQFLLAHFAHVDVSHALGNLLPAAVCLMVVVRLSHLILIVLLSAFALSAALSLGEFEYRFYAGLSGVVCAMWMYMGVERARQDRYAGGWVIGILLAKLVFDTSIEREVADAAIAVASHWLGAAIGGLVSLVLCLSKKPHELVSLEIASVRLGGRYERIFCGGDR